MTRISERLLVQWFDDGPDGSVVFRDEYADTEVQVAVYQIPTVIAALEYFASLAGSAPVVPAQRPAGEGPDPQVPDGPGAAERRPGRVGSESVMLIPESGPVRQLTLPGPTDIAGQLSRLLAAIGCTAVEAIHLVDGLEMWVDEEGMLAQRPVNSRAETVAYCFGGELAQHLHGPVVIAASTVDGDLVGVGQERLDELDQLLS